MAKTTELEDCWSTELDESRLEKLQSKSIVIAELLRGWFEQPLLVCTVLTLKK